MSIYKGQSCDSYSHTRVYGKVNGNISEQNDATESLSIQQDQALVQTLPIATPRIAIKAFLFLKHCVDKFLI